MGEEAGKVYSNTAARRFMHVRPPFFNISGLNFSSTELDRVARSLKNWSVHKLVKLDFAIRYETGSAYLYWRRWQIFFGEEWSDFFDPPFLKAKNCTLSNYRTFLRRFPSKLMWWFQCSAFAERSKSHNKTRHVLQARWSRSCHFQAPPVHVSKKLKPPDNKPD